MEEIWKEFYFNNAQYWVSNFGRVKGVKGLLTQHLRYDGYPVVTLGGRDKNGKLKREQKTVHRIVATVFIPNPNNCSDVNHIDFDKTNNKIENLEWCNHIDNVKHSSENGRYEGKSRGQKNPKARLTEEQVIEIRRKYDSGEMTQMEIAKKYNVGWSTVHNIVFRLTWKHI